MAKEKDVVINEYHLNRHEPDKPPFAILDLNNHIKNNSRVTKPHIQSFYQLGYRLGFDDASYLVKYFKKHTNLSPSEFRKSVS